MHRLGLGLGLIPTAARPAATTAPVNVDAPSVTGIRTQGQTVSADPGSWTGLPSGVFAYQWQRWNGSAWVNIAGATAQTRVLDASDQAAGALGVRVAVTATNDVGSTTANSAAITVLAPLAISGTPEGATVGVAYTFTPNVSGGRTPRTFALTGTLPAGLSFNTSTGAITGTPTTSGTAGSLNITVTDADGLTAALGVFSIAVDAGGPVAGDLLSMTVLGSTPVVTAPTNNIDPNGRVVALTFKGMTANLAADHTKVSLTVRYPAFDSTGAATTLDETMGLNGWLRMPFPPAWASGVAVPQGQWRSNRVSSKGNIYLCVTAGPGNTANAPTHASFVGQEVTGADLYTWRYLGNPTDSTSATTSAPSRRMETTSGGDVTLYGVPAKSIPAGAQIVACTVQAGAYGASRASNPAIVTFNHSQTLAARKPYLVRLTKRRQLVTNTIRLETIVQHHAARNARPTACHKWIIYNAAFIPVATLTSVAVSRSALATAGMVIQGYCRDYDTSGLADGDYFIAEESYPHRGAAYKTADDGYGATTLTTSGPTTANTQRYIYFRKAASPTIRYAYFDGTGAGGGTVSTNAATARANPHASLRAAMLALQTANGGVVDATCVVRAMDKGSAYDAGFGGNMQSGITYGVTKPIIEIDPLATPGSVVFAPLVGVTTANKQGPNRCVWRGIGFTGGSSWSAMDNVANGTTIGDFTIEQDFENCAITGVAGSAQNPIARGGLLMMYDPVLTNVGSNFGKGTHRTALFVFGGTVRGGSGATQVAAVAIIGAIWDRNGGISPVPAPPDARFWADGSGSTSAHTPNEFTFYMFNRWTPATALVVTANGSSSGAAKEAVTRGCVVAMNMIEVADTDSNGSSDTKGGQYSGDTDVNPIPELLFSDNTVVGDGPNLCYNEAGFAAKYLYGGRNWMDDINHKGDYWDATTASEAKIGNIFARYHQDFELNFIPGTSGSFNRLPSPGNNIGDAWSANEVKPTSATPLGRNFTDDKSFYSAGAKTGGGTYRPTAGNGAIGMITSTAQLAFPEDLAGNTRVVGGAVGAYEMA